MLIVNFKLRRIFLLSILYSLLDFKVLKISPLVTELPIPIIKVHTLNYKYKLNYLFVR
jgi:hypothetical protein